MFYLQFDSCINLDLLIHIKQKSMSSNQSNPILNDLKFRKNHLDSIF